MERLYNDHNIRLITQSNCETITTTLSFLIKLADESLIIDGVGWGGVSKSVLHYI